MANPPPPYADITGISRTVMKDNAQESISNYDGNARPGELVVNLLNNDVYIGNTNGDLNLISTGGGGAHADPSGPVGSLQLNAGGNLFTGSANLTFVSNTLTVTGNSVLNGNNVVTEVISAFDPDFTDVNNIFAGGTVTGSYVLHNSICTFHVNVDFVGTTNYGNSQYQITLPFPAHATWTSTNGTLHQIGSGGGSGANTLYHIAGHTDSTVSTSTMKLFYSQTASDLQWKFNTPGGVPPGNTLAYWAIAGDAHFDISGTYQIA